MVTNNHPLTLRITVQQVSVSNAHRVVIVKINFNVINGVLKPKNGYLGLDQMKVFKSVYE